MFFGPGPFHGTDIDSIPERQHLSFAVTRVGPKKLSPGDKIMMTIEEIQKNQKLIDAIDWEMTPEEAVRLYLEWGNNWTRGNYVIRSKKDVSHYFVVNTWGKAPTIYLLRRNSEDCEELAQIELPEGLRERFLESIGNNKGVYSVDGEVRRWLKNRLKET
jgi:hypothetical protein